MGVLLRAEENLPPIPSFEVVIINQDSQSNKFTLGGYDPEGSNLTFRVVKPPRYGLLNLNTNTGAAEYRPAHGKHRGDSFRYVVCDGQLESEYSEACVVETNGLSDTNHNQMPDDWEARWNLSDPAGDEDGDGMTNLAEYLADTSPRNATDLLRILNIQRNSEGHTILTWHAKGGVRYRIYSGEPLGLETQIWEERSVDEEMDPAPNGESNLRTFVDTRPLQPEETRFYRIGWSWE